MPTNQSISIDKTLFNEAETAILSQEDFEDIRVGDWVLVSIKKPKRDTGLYFVKSGESSVKLSREKGERPLAYVLGLIRKY